MVNEFIPSNKKEQILEQTIQLILQKFSDRPDLMVRKMMREPTYLQHALEVCRHARESDYVSPALVELNIRIAECLMRGFRNFEKAKLIIENVDDMLQKGIKISALNDALLKINKSFLSSMYMPNYNESSRYNLEALDILNQFEGLFEEKLRATTSLAQNYMLSGQQEKGKHLLARASTLFKNSKSHVYNAAYLYANSIVFNDEGNFDQSINVINEAKQYLPKIQDYPMLEFHLLMQELEALLKLNHLTEANICFEKCYDKVQHFFHGKDNYILGRLLIYKAWILMNNEHKNQEAVETILKSINMLNNVLHGPGKHIMQGFAHIIYGNILEDLDCEEALKAYLTSEAIYKKIMQNLQSDDISLLYSRIVNLTGKIKDHKTAHHYLEKHIRVFGTYHFRTQKMKKLLDTSIALNE